MTSTVFWGSLVNKSQDVFSCRQYFGWVWWTSHKMYSAVDSILVESGEQVTRCIQLSTVFWWSLVNKSQDVFNCRQYFWGVWWTSRKMYSAVDCILGESDEQVTRCIQLSTICWLSLVNKSQDVFSCRLYFGWVWWPSHKMYSAVDSIFGESGEQVTRCIQLSTVFWVSLMNKSQDVFSCRQYFWGVWWTSHKMYSTVDSIFGESGEQVTRCIQLSTVFLGSLVNKSQDVFSCRLYFGESGEQVTRCIQLSTVFWGVWWTSHKMYSAVDIIWWTSHKMYSAVDIMELHFWIKSDTRRSDSRSGAPGIQKQ